MFFFLKLPLCPKASPNLNFLSFKGYRAAAAGETADCTCVFVSTSQEYGQSEWSVLSWCCFSSVTDVINSKSKGNAGKGFILSFWVSVSLTFLYIYFYFYCSPQCFLSLEVFSQVGIRWLVWQGVDLYTQQELHMVTRTHQERAIKTTPCQLAL